MTHLSNDILLFSYVKGQHLAIAAPFEAVYASLLDEGAKGRVNRVVNKNGDLELFSYSMGCQFEGT